MTWRVTCFWLLLLLYGFLLDGARVYAEHRVDLAWMLGYTAANGMPCCGTIDCREAAITVQPLEGDATRRLVLVNGVPLTLPAASVHHSENGQSYWCFAYPTPVPQEDATRCVFWAEGM